QRYELTFAWNDGSETTLRPEAAPLSKVRVELPVGKSVEGNCSAIVTAVDTVSGQVVSEEQLVLSQRLPAAPETRPLPDTFRVKDGKVSLTLPNGQLLCSAEQDTLLYRAATDNDTNLLFQNTMKPYFAQKEALVSTEEIENGVRVTTKVSNKKASFLVTDTYQGTADGVLVTSRLRCVSGGGTVPRFGKCFRLDECFDQVEYTARCGESYYDMKEQFPIRTVRSTVADMTEPNLKPQESGNRCDCTAASLSDGKTSVSFLALEKPYELGIKPYTDKALFTMKHREDEKRTGTYVTIQAFQQGIGTGACGPGIMPEFCYAAKEEYEMKFLISVAGR
ncbi:MAG: hypothetical protein IJV64_14250, partial [Oscillospiraceae bacterium]|nr:hypothetical protein [Oscillospiraceae bacterium]